MTEMVHVALLTESVDGNNMRDARLGVMDGRSPYGERGLKLLVLSWHEGLEESLSLRRAWIEIPTGRSAWWCSTRRSPYGERGLKYQVLDGEFVGFGSLSLRRAWIEIVMRDCVRTVLWSLSLRRAWIEI